MSMEPQTYQINRKMIDSKEAQQSADDDPKINHESDYCGTTTS
jgi:hypothetical protein